MTTPRAVPADDEFEFGFGECDIFEKDVIYIPDGLELPNVRARAGGVADLGACCAHRGAWRARAVCGTPAVTP